MKDRTESDRSRALALFRRMLKDGKFTIRPITSGDTANIVRWRNSAEVIKNLATQEKLTHKAHDNYMATHVQTGLVVQFILTYKGEDIGTGFLKNIDKKFNRAETGLFIGEEKYLGSGAGVVGSELIINHAFDVLKLDYLYCRILKSNQGAIRMNKMLGFEDMDDPFTLEIPSPDDPQMAYLILRKRQ